MDPHACWVTAYQVGGPGCSTSDEIGGSSHKAYRHAIALVGNGLRSVGVRADDVAHNGVVRAAGIGHANAAPTVAGNQVLFHAVLVSAYFNAHPMAAVAQPNAAGDIHTDVVAYPPIFVRSVTLQTYAVLSVGADEVTFSGCFSTNAIAGTKDVDAQSVVAHGLFVGHIHTHEIARDNMLFGALVEHDAPVPVATDDVSLSEWTPALPAVPSNAVSIAGDKNSGFGKSEHLQTHDDVLIRIQAKPMPAEEATPIQNDACIAGVYGDAALCDGRQSAFSFNRGRLIGIKDRRGEVYPCPIDRAFQACAESPGTPIADGRNTAGSCSGRRPGGLRALRQERYSLSAEVGELCRQQALAVGRIGWASSCRGPARRRGEPGSVRPEMARPPGPSATKTCS